MSASKPTQARELAAGEKMHDLAPPDYCDPVIEAYKKDVDRTLLRENVKLSVEERIRKAEKFHEMLDEVRRAGAESQLRAAKKGVMDREAFAELQAILEQCRNKGPSYQLKQFPKCFRR